MKTTRILQFFFLVATAAFFSCGSEDSSEDDGNGGNQNQISSISLTANLSTIELGNSVTFTVTSNLNTDLTSEAAIQVNGAAISGNSFTPESSGSYEVKATYETFNSDVLTITATPVIVSIDIEVNSETVNIGDTIDYSVIGTDSEDNTHDLTESSKVFLNDTESFTRNTFIPSETGTIEAYATNNGLTTPTVSVTVEDTEIAPSSFTQKALIEDFTGTWCGWCPRVSHSIELVEEESNNVAVVAAHLSGGDPYQNNYGVQLANYYGIESFPTAYVNKAAIWEYPEPNNVEQVLNLAQGTNTSGISINSTVDKRNISVFVSAAFGEDLSGVKMAVLLLENGLIYAQQNYTNYYNGSSVVQNFQHDNVLRYAFTSVNGDELTSSETAANNLYRMKYEYSIPIGTFNNPNNAEVVVLLLDSNNNLINANFAEIGVDKDFD